MSLVEVLVAVLVLAMVVGPLYLVFSGSRKNMLAARELSLAISLASSYLAGLRQVPPERLIDLPASEDIEVTGPLALAALGVATAPPGITRRLSLTRVDPGGGEGGPYYQAEVVVQWTTRTARQTVTYTLASLLRGPRP